MRNLLVLQINPHNEHFTEQMLLCQRVKELKYLKMTKSALRRNGTLQQPLLLLHLHIPSTHLQAIITLYHTMVVEDKMDEEVIQERCLHAIRVVLLAISIKIALKTIIKSLRVADMATHVLVIMVPYTRHQLITKMLVKLI